MRNVKRLFSLFVAVLAAFSLAACKPKEKIIGTWKMSRTVYQKEKDGDTLIGSREENASLYESEQSYYQFNSDGTAVHHIEDGGGAMDVKGTWKKTDDLSYSYEDEQGMKTQFNYVVSEDALHVDWYSDQEGSDYYYVLFVYARK